MALKVPQSLPAKAADAGTRVDVWTIRLDVSPDATNAALTRLSPDEQTRANSFRNETAQRNYILSHAALRSILAQQLQLAPDGIQFSTGSYGKPALAGTAAGRLEFNLTHSRDLALVAVAHGAEVGVDVEPAREMRDALQIAERFFSKAESEALRQLPAAEQSTCFLNLWTRKEAVAKATGFGIANSLTRFEVTWGDETAVRSIDGDPRLAAEWTLRAFKPAPSYIAAIAVHSPAAQLSFHEFQTAPI